MTRKSTRAAHNRQPALPAGGLPDARQLLGGLTVEEFLDQYWQKKPLLVRTAFPGFTGLLSNQALWRLTRQDDVESRWVRQGDDRQPWTLQQGPFSRQEVTDWRRLKQPWTVLVQGLNLHLPAADALMRCFNFIPYARLDDLMVSYAVADGGVGPHFDNYDVFLLQGQGRRRWRIGNQNDMRLIEDLPLRILKDFRPTEEWVAESGDLIYLPPQYAHEGVALNECTTYSIGFRTPPAQELAEQFLMFLAERIDLPGRYSDPDLKPQTQPAALSTAMVGQCARMLKGIRWNRVLVEEFLGSFLTEPKSQVVFARPEPPLSRPRFEADATQNGLRLDAKTQLLYRGQQVFINGERVRVATANRPTLFRLANERHLKNCASLGIETWDLLHEWYGCGFLHVGLQAD